MLAVDKPLAYHKPVVQVKIVTLLSKVAASPSFVNGSVISWLVKFTSSVSRLYTSSFVYFTRKSILQC